MPDEPTMTETQVKTKTVSKTAMAIAVAFLGISAIAAAGVTFKPSDMVNGFACADSDVAIKNSDNSSMKVYNYVNFAQKGTVSTINPASGSTSTIYNFTERCKGAQLVENFCNVINKKLYQKVFNCPTGTNCVDGACVMASSTPTSTSTPSTPTSTPQTPTSTPTSTPINTPTSTPTSTPPTTTSTPKTPTTTPTSTY